MIIFSDSYFASYEWCNGGIVMNGVMVSVAMGQHCIERFQFIDMREMIYVGTVGEI